ncbi:hypothetical protein GBAR_LOCUS25806 [Geodia barretti]|uniref:Uncharacterized protein n=1 Tax=Geodia barretti TaxID=519541 RepID=A0AA35TE50_GEOBA|nr:hypothetical protein GBAR_LOCUS25806 [Geodia barretti]
MFRLRFLLQNNYCTLAAIEKELVVSDVCILDGGAPTSGISTLDIRTRLRISEAELAIVQREVADLISEKDQLESNARLYEDSWKFAVQECGRIVEQRDDLQRKLLSLENALSTARHQENHKDSKKKKVTKADLDQCKTALETQTRVAETLEHERDQAYDDYQFAQAQLHTLMHQYQQLSNVCSEVARERDKARAEAALLRDEIHHYEAETESQVISLSRSASSRKMSESDAPRVSRTSLSREETELLVGDGPSEDLPPEDQVKELREERDLLRTMYDMLLKRSEQYQRQVQRADEERRQALATSEALTAVWQKKFEKAEQVQHDLALELRSAENRIKHLSQQLALSRLQGGDGPRHSPSEGELAKISVHNSSSSHEEGKFSQPQRTASFHGSFSNSTTAPYTHNSSKASLTKKPSRSSGSINKVLSRDRQTISTSSTSSSHEPLSLRSDHSTHSNKRNQRMEYSDYGAGTGSSQSTEDEASWI